MTDDLFLLYKFTDRGGNLVYDIYKADDNKTRKNKLGETRMKPPMSNLERQLRDDYQVDTWDPTEPYPDEPGFKEE
jgi:hypothetical protein